MLKSLRHLKAEDAERVLLDLADELLPLPVASEVMLDETHTRVLAELYSGSEPPANLSQSRIPAAVFEALVAELTSRFLPKNREEAARRRLGEAGELRPDLYEVKFIPSFAVAEARGIRRSHVQAAIRNPDQIEHLSRGLEGMQNSITFAFKRFDGKDPFVLHVQAMRHGATLVVMNALRIYEHDVQLNGARTPEEILKRFVDEYGLIFEYGSAGPAKYMQDLYVPDVEAFDDETEPTVNGIGGHVVEAAMAVRSTAIGGTHIGYGYVLDALKYQTHLRQHGVAVSDTYISVLKKGKWGSAFRPM